MESVFSMIWQTALTASFIMAAVMVVRLLLKRAPKAFTMALWGLVALRLLISFSFESAFSLVPKQLAEYEPAVTTATTSVTRPSVSKPITTVSKPTAVVTQTTVAESGMTQSVAVVTTTPTVPTQDVSPAGVTTPVSWTAVVSYIWLGGAVLMLCYGVWSYGCVRRRVNASLRLRDNIFACDTIDTPFILGVFRPKIYCPSGMSDEDSEQVIAHEQAHIRHGDHITKWIGFLLLCVYWFHPMVWLSYILFCRDMESACDERVIQSMSPAQKARYAEVLMVCSVSHRAIISAPLSFGEIGVKARLTSILHYKKPTLWVVLAGVVVIVVTAVCFLTVPKTDKPQPTVHESAPPREQSLGSYFRVYDEDGESLLRHTHLYDVEAVTLEQDGSEPHYAIQMTLNPKGTTLFADQTAERAGQTLSLYIKGDVVASLTVSDPITDGNMLFVCEGLSSLEQAEALVDAFGFSREEYLENVKNEFERENVVSLRKENWQYEGLRSLELTPLVIEEKGQIACGRVYLLSEVGVTEHRSLQDTYLALETDHDVTLMALGKNTYIEDIACYDLDGQTGEEILVHEDTGGNGGFGACVTKVFRVTPLSLQQQSHSNVFQTIFDSSNAKSYRSGLGDCYSFTLPDYKEVFVDVATGKASLLRHISDDARRMSYDTNGIPTQKQTLYKDSTFYRYEVYDEDGDGTLELIGYYYAYSHTRANHIGEIRAVFGFSSEFDELKMYSSELIPDPNKAILESPTSQPHVVDEQTVTLDDVVTLRYPVFSGVGGAQTINEALSLAVREKFVGIKSNSRAFNIREILTADNRYVITESDEHISILFLLHMNTVDGNLGLPSVDSVSFTLTFDKATGNRVDALSLLKTDDAFAESVYRKMHENVTYLEGFDMVKTYSEEKIVKMIENCDTTGSLFNSFVCGEYVALTYSVQSGYYTMYFKK